MPTEKQIHEGHRRRMYARVERDGFDSLAPHEALEYLLYFTNARRDTNALAHALLDRFGDFASVLEASEEDLMQVDGIGPTTARLLHGLLPVSRYYARTCAGKKRSLNTTESLAEFLQAQFLHLQQERAMLISLNRSRQVRSAVWLREGGRQAVWLDIQEIVTAALKGGTSVVVLCHNHPNGMVLPSMEDMRATGELAHALLDRFGDFASVLEASEEDLMQVDGIGPTTARLLHGLLPVSRYYARTCAGKKRSLNTTESLAEFLQAQFLHLQQERAMLISLNRSRQVRSAVWLREGGRQAVWLDIQEIVTAALKGGTSVVVLCHNHPNGMVLPSMEDMRATGEVVRALGLVGVQLTDHIIVTQEEYFTMRRRGSYAGPKSARCVQSKGPYKRKCAMGRKDFERLPQQERQFLAFKRS